LRPFALQLADLVGVEPADVEAVIGVEGRRDRGTVASSTEAHTVT
jgi:hypothetical protein